MVRQWACPANLYAKRFKTFILTWTVNSTECLQQAGEVVPDKTKEIQDHKFGQIMKTRSAHLLGLFLMVYVGVEVTIGGV